MKTFSALAILLLASAPAFGQVVVSDNQTILAEQKVKASIQGQTASVTLEVVLENPLDRVAEGTVMVPLPKGTAVSDFTMKVGDRVMKPELLDAKKARAIYESIVRRKKDPALLEVAGNSALRLSAFPIPARGRVSLTVHYSYRVPRDGGILRFQVPAFARSPVRKALLELDLRSEDPIGVVYSPTHPVDVARPTKRHVRVTYEGTHLLDLPVFTLYATAGGNELGCSLSTYRDGGEPGHFMLVVSPDMDEKVLPKDIVFIVDRSGSMSGEKMEQARSAVEYCIDHLARADAFAIVDFASAVQSSDLAAATAKNRTRGKEILAKLKAGGGTNLEAAIRESLRLLVAREGRVPVVFVITDGHPTVGEVDHDTILKKAKDGNRAGARIFTFGVGGDVDTRLLDRLALEGGGIADVVQPGERIDDRTAGLFHRVGAPVLADIKVKFDGVKVNDFCPRKIPDLFRGGEIILAGRYTGSGKATVQIRGRSSSGKRKYEFKVHFPKSDRSDFEVARLWARRKIAFLLDQVRLQDRPPKELVDEIVSLSRKYRVATPYTSFLIMEDGEPLAQRERVIRELTAFRRRASVVTPVDSQEAFGALKDSRSMHILSR